MTEALVGITIALLAGLVGGLILGRRRRPIPGSDSDDGTPTAITEAIEVGSRVLKASSLSERAAVETVTADPSPGPDGPGLADISNARRLERDK